MSILAFVDKVEKERTINPKDISYIGIFFDKQMISDLAIFGERLDKIIENPHITLAFNPTPDKLKQLSDFMNEHPNSDITANITRYGNDGKNEGFYVESIICSDGSDVPYFGAEQKHITISVAKKSSPVKTGFMNFDQPVSPIQIGGKIGIFMNDKTIKYSPISIENEIKPNTKETEHENRDDGR